MKKTFAAEKNYDRTDVFLSEAAEISRSSAKRLIENGCASCSGEKVKPSRAVAKGEEFEVDFPQAEEYSARPENIPLDIVYEDDYLAVINKPQGMTVHAGNGNTSGTLVNALLYNLDSLSGINGVLRPGIVHRIDKDTSGLLVVAKCDEAHISLSKQIAEKTCKRTYIALLEGRVKDDRGRITTYIGRNPADRLKMAVVPPDKGKLAVTDFEVIKRYENFTLCKFGLFTGRTHQIRVHAKYMGHPVVGDPVYGVKKQKFKLSGQLLHACELTLVHPKTGEEMTFSAPLPDYFLQVLEKIK